jgi:hypothetical protein
LQLTHLTNHAAIDGDMYIIEMQLCVYIFFFTASVAHHFFSVL